MRELENEGMRELVNGVWGYVRGMRLRLVKRLNTKKGNVMIGKMMSLPPYSLTPLL